MKQILLLAALAVVVAAPATARRPPEAADVQLAFGVKMAQRGLWKEALFRFEQAQKARPGDTRILNNLAVACEALGRFDRALELYREALRLAPGNGDVRANYDRFVSFYESFRAEKKEDDAGGAAPEEGR